LVLPAPVSAEIDYFLYSRFGPRVAAGFLEDLADGVFQVECLSESDYADVVSVNRRYADLHLGLADLSIVVLARRFNTRRILTFDARHFRAVHPLQGGFFTLLPDDA
jgi:predicted nucleic acid-binding protein